MIYLYCVYVHCASYLCTVIRYFFYLCLLFIVIIHLFCSLFNFLSLYCLTFVLLRLFCFSLFIVHCSKEKRFNSDPGPYSRYFDPAYNIIYSMRVNKHPTADCTDFVLVQERRTYYDHRHSGIDETNILQRVISVEGETITCSLESIKIKTSTRLAYFRLSIGFSKAYCHHRCWLGYTEPVSPTGVEEGETVLVNTAEPLIFSCQEQS
jgi:hypothetical protein